MLEFLQQHEFWSAVALYWIFSAAVDAMDDPMPGGSQGYRWFFKFSHTIAGNLSTAFGSRVPGLNKGFVQLRALATLVLISAVLLVGVPSCARYVVHPGSANTTDSMAYDALRDAQAVIDTARPQFASGALSANLKPAFNALIAAYDIAAPAWKTYHDAALAGKQVDLVTLNKDLSDLAAALGAFRKGK